MRYKTLLFAALSLALAPVALAQDGDSVFKPAGDWTADYGDDYCRLIRTFSDGKETLSLALERTQPGDFLRLIFVGDALKPYRSAEELGYQFLPGGAAGKTRYVRAETTDGNPFLGLDTVTLTAFAVTPGTTPPAYNQAKELEAARGVTALALGEGLTSPVLIETGSLRAPMAAMQTCTDDLLTVWKLDPARHKAMTAPPVPDPAPNGVLPMGTIPFTEFGKFAGGANQVRLMIGADGKPTACTVYQPTLDAPLNQRICAALLDKATFQPAEDAAGQPMASYWMGPPLAFGPPPPPGFRR